MLAKALQSVFFSGAAFGWPLGEQLTSGRTLRVRQISVDGEIICLENKITLGEIGSMSTFRPEADIVLCCRDFDS